MRMVLNQYSNQPIANYNDGTGDQRCVRQLEQTIEIMGVDYDDCYQQYIELKNSSYDEFEIVEVYDAWDKSRVGHKIQFKDTLGIISEGIVTNYDYFIGFEINNSFWIDPKKYLGDVL